MQVLTVKDTAMFGLPAEMIPTEAVKNGAVDLDAAPELHRKLQDAGLLMAGSQGNTATLMGSQQWTVTNDPAVLAAWQPGCSCETCVKARDDGLAYMQEHPDRFMAFCDMEYTVVRTR